MDLLAQFKSRLLSRRVNKESATEEEEEEETEEPPVISEANNNDTSTAEGEGDDDEEMENKTDWYVSCYLIVLLCVSEWIRSMLVLISEQEQVIPVIIKIKI